MRRIGVTLVMCQDLRTQSRDTDDSQEMQMGQGRETNNSHNSIRLILIYFLSIYPLTTPASRIHSLPIHSLPFYLPSPPTKRLPIQPLAPREQARQQRNSRPRRA